jgi:hypothetical protein
MKRLTMNCMLAAAALTAVATSASAQSMKAEIPFTFHAGQALLAPGAYQLTIDRGLGGRYFLLRNTDTRKAVLVSMGSGSEAQKAWSADGKPRLRFECAGARCALRQVWVGPTGHAHTIPGPSFGRDEAIRTTEVALSRVKAE